MSISFINSNFSFNNNTIPDFVTINTNSISANDLLIALISYGTPNSISSMPSNWNLLSGSMIPDPAISGVYSDIYQNYQNIYYKIATSADSLSSSYTWALSVQAGYHGAVGILSIYRGVNTTNPFSTSAINIYHDGNNPTMSAATVNISNSNSWIILTYTGRSGSDTFNQPAGYTLRSSPGSTIQCQLADSNIAVNTGIVSPGNWSATPGNFACGVLVTISLNSILGRTFKRGFLRARLKQ